MTREEATELILEAKDEKGLTCEAIAGKVGRHKVWLPPRSSASTR